MTVRRGSSVKSGDDRSEPRERHPKPVPIAQELHCKRCGGGMVLVTVISKFGDQPSYKLFRCVACEFLDWVKA
jgi:DNA-directed RNA polymerase subunit M/transcription elongation factor TFIIS